MEDVSGANMNSVDFHEVQSSTERIEMKAYSENDESSESSTDPPPIETITSLSR